MAGDQVDRILDELAGWAEARDQDVAGNGADADTLLQLLRDYADVTDLSELTPYAMRQVLLTHYPRKITVLEDADLKTVPQSARELVQFAADTGRLSSETASAIIRTVDDVEQVFAETVMNPSNWGMARTFT